MIVDVAANLAAVQSRITAACERAGRAATDVRLIAVSKTHPAAVVRQLHDAGQRVFGENRVQEAAEKADTLTGTPDLRWALIGHLQSNKINAALRFADEFHALDSVRLAEALDRRLQTEGRSLDAYLQVNTSGEPQKYGLDPAEALDAATTISELGTLRLRGLMTLAVFSDDQARVARCFATLADLRDRLGDRTGGELSMGMSGDFELAIAHGATTVRVGQAIFGARS